MTTEIGELRDRARAAGARGATYQDWLWDEGPNAGEAVCALRDAGDHSVEEAHREGARAKKVTDGWVAIWTTAPADYDCFGTEEVERCGTWCGKALRRVLAHPHHAVYQEDRYGSGLHFSGREDPRVEEARRVERLAAEARERAAAEGRRAGGLFWLRELPEAELEGDDEDALDALLRERGCGWPDVRAERKRRAEARAAAARAAQWARCRALFPDGATLIDDGAPSRDGSYGFRIPGRDPAAYRAVEVRVGYRVEAGFAKPDADEALVHANGGQSIGSLADVAARIERRELRLARPDEHVPPLAVVERLGCSFKEVLRFDVAAGPHVWVGRPRFAYDPVVLDDRGHLVRKKAIVEAALRALRERDFGGAR